MQAGGHSGHSIYSSGYDVGYTLELEWDASSDTTAIQRERDAARAAVAALVELGRDFITLQEFGLTKQVMHHQHGAWLDTESRPPQWHWYLKQAGAETEPMYIDAISATVEEIDAAAMLNSVDTLMAAPCELSADQWPAWAEMYTHNTSVRIPDALVPRAVDYLVLDDDDNRQRGRRIPLARRQDGAWVSRPELGDWVPISVRVNRSEVGYSGSDFHYDQLTLTVSVNWSLWWREGSPGRGMLDAAFERLESKGWRPEPD